MGGFLQEGINVSQKRSVLSNSILDGLKKKNPNLPSVILKVLKLISLLVVSLYVGQNE